MNQAKLVQLKAHLQSAIELLDSELGTVPTTAPIAFGVADKVAFLHWEAEQKKGSPLTVSESREIRRGVYGDSIRGSAALFGREFSNHILWRNVPFGTRLHNKQQVRLTEHGLTRAKAYAAAQSAAA